MLERFEKVIQDLENLRVEPLFSIVSPILGIFDCVVDILLLGIVFL